MRINKLSYNIIIFILSARTSAKTLGTIFVSDQGYTRGRCRGLCGPLCYEMYCLPYNRYPIDTRAKPGYPKREGVVGETVGFPTTK